MKILYLGEIGPGQTALMRMRALQRLGHEVVGVNTIKPWQQAGWWRRQVQRRRNRGSVVDEINASVVNAAREFLPELVWADKQEYLRAETVATLRRSGARTAHFTPDPYFTLRWKRTRLMDQTMAAFDVLFYCKTYERADYERLDKPTFYMPLGYCDESHRPFSDGRNRRWECPVGFLGGWEPRRQRLLRAVAGLVPGLRFRGGHWEFIQDGRWTLRRRIILGQLSDGEPVRIRRDKLLAPCHQGGEVYGDDYARALTGAKIGLGFLRTICPDQHTTRTFEIPACGSMLLGDRTAECRELFEEGTEAEYFDSGAELLDKLRFYTKNESARSRIAAAGRQRCISGRYSYVERMADALQAMELSAVQ